MGYLKHCFFAEVMISKTEYKQGTLAEKVDTMTKMFDIKTFSGMFCFAAVITLTSCANHFHHIITLIYIDMWTRYLVSLVVVQVLLIISCYINRYLKTDKENLNPGNRCGGSIVC